MSVKEYIDKYIGYIRVIDSDGFLILVKGTHLFHFGYKADKLSNEKLCENTIIQFLAEHEIKSFYSTWDKEDGLYIPADIGYSKREKKWYSLNTFESFNTREEIYEEYRNFYKNYLPKYK